MSSGHETDAEGRAPAFELTASRQFTSWMAEQQVSLAFTTYQAGKLFLLGLQPDGRLSVFERTFARCLGLWSDGQTMWMSSLYQLWRFENALEPGQDADGHDRLFVPQVGYTTGDIDIHDVAVDDNGQVLFVNTLFGCLATTSETHSFVPRWKPPFLSKLAAEDRCHLNGVAMESDGGDQANNTGQPRYVTCVGRSDVTDGWREHRRGGGLVLDVTSGEVVASGFSMPHSPRLYQGRLWILDSGSGYFGYVDIESGQFERIAFCPGYMRGLSFIGDYAVIGMSTCRENRTFSGLALDEELSERGATARCGLSVVNLKTGDVAHWVRLEGVVTELYDVVTLAGVVRPSVIGFRTDEIRRVLSVGEERPFDQAKQNSSE